MPTTSQAKTSFFAASLACALFTLTALPATAADAPEGWFMAGSKPQSYETGIDEEASYIGNASAYLKSTKDEIEGFGTLMQQISPEQYRGYRVRLSGYAKSENIDEWAGLWMRVDGAPGSRPLAFDNMQDRRITGTTDWQYYEIILDVAAEASNIAFGFLLDGTGAMWVDGLSMDIVDQATPATSSTSSTSLERPQNPQNLDFEN